MAWPFGKDRTDKKEKVTLANVGYGENASQEWAWWMGASCMLGVSGNVQIVRAGSCLLYAW